MVVKSRLFKSNRSQAMRIPKALAFPEGVEEVEIVRVGSNLIVSPVGKRWDDLFERGPRMPEDFMEERIDPLPEEREPL